LSGESRGPAPAGLHEEAICISITLPESPRVDAGPAGSPISFDEFSLHPETIRAIGALGWARPTPIQAKVIPIMVAGGDIVGQAQTGSGKTGAYGIPLVERLNPQAATLQGLVLTPTRELALQVADDLRALGRERGHKIVALYGGQPIERQLAELARRPNIAVATPGRLLDHLQRGTAAIGRVDTVVLDEADRMLDMGFLPDVSSILKRTPRGRQTALFSATIPAEIRAIAGQHMRAPLWVAIETAAPTVETVDQFYVEVAEEDKVAALRRLLRDEPIQSGLVFRRTRHRADRLGRAFAKSRQAAIIHGGMREGARLRALRDFEARRVRLLIATNVAARGLDLADVSHVVNYDIPEDVDTYIHRIGRTARAGRSGTAITFVSQYDLEAFDHLRRAIGQALRRHPLNLYDAPRPGR